MAKLKDFGGKPFGVRVTNLENASGIIAETYKYNLIVTSENNQETPEEALNKIYLSGEHIASGFGLTNINHRKAIEQYIIVNKIEDKYELEALNIGVEDITKGLNIKLGNNLLTSSNLYVNEYSVDNNKIVHSGELQLIKNDTNFLNNTLLNEIPEIINIKVQNGNNWIDCPQPVLNQYNIPLFNGSSIWNMDIDFNSTIEPNLIKTCKLCIITKNYPNGIIAEIKLINPLKQLVFVENVENNVCDLIDIQVNNYARILQNKIKENNESIFGVFTNNELGNYSKALRFAEEDSSEHRLYIDDMVNLLNVEKASLLHILPYFKTKPNNVGIFEKFTFAYPVLFSNMDADFVKNYDLNISNNDFNHKEEFNSLYFQPSTDTKIIYPKIYIDDSRYILCKPIKMYYNIDLYNSTIQYPVPIDYSKFNSNELNNISASLIYNNGGITLRYKEEDPYADYYAVWEGSGTTSNVDNTIIGGKQYKSLSSPIKKYKFYYEDLTALPFGTININQNIIRLLYCDTSNITTLNAMFYNCGSLKYVNCKDWNTSKVTSTNSMFKNCKQIKEIALSNWDTLNLSNLTSMFSSCYELTTIDVSQWNTIKANLLNSMFFKCLKLSSINCENWNTSNVTDMTYMFRKCISLTNINLSKWNVSNVKYMTDMFRECDNLVSVDASTWNMSDTVSIDGMFLSCPNLVTVKLHGLKTNLALTNSPKFSINSIIYIIDNAVDNKQIIITLHPSVFEEAKNNKEVNEALTRKQNITLVK